FAIPYALAADSFGMKVADRITIVHAEGAQIYECQADAAGALAWKFKEPIATLFERGKSIGRHYAGPSWEFADGAVLKAKVIAQAPAATSADIPELLLTVTAAKGDGAISTARTIVRLHTKGGAVQGSCQAAGELRSVAYSADYAFFGNIRD